ncbi:MAG: PA2779 family protein [Alphaproteobacteria bacterium]|nr:PA2779 family protein [Alphaproteobacteria bacterium]
MRFLREQRRSIAILAIASFMTASVAVPAANAKLVTTERVASADVQTQRDRITSFLKREDVRAQMQRLGVSPDEAEARVAGLSDAEVSRISGNLDTMPAGQGALGTILGVALVIFIVLLITDILGFTHVFGFTNKGSAK